jgi:hypothetical protein
MSLMTQNGHGNSSGGRDFNALALYTKHAMSPR